MPDRWNELSAFFHAALAQPPDQRGQFLADAGADEALRRQVMVLLECHDPAAAFLAGSAMEVMSAGVADGTESLVGRQLGSYRLDSLIGAGGMGQVYKATDTRLHRTVAVKILALPFCDPQSGSSSIEKRRRSPHCGIRTSACCMTSAATARCSTW